MGSVYKYVRYLAYFIEILVLYVIEQIPNFIPGVNGARPILVLPVVFIIAVFEGENPALMFGFFSGMLLDISSSGRIGFYTVAVALVAYILGISARYIIETVNFFNAIIGCFLSIFIVYSSYFVVMFVSKGFPEAMYAFTSYYLIGMLYTFLMTPLIYFFNRALAINIRRGE